MSLSKNKIKYLSSLKIKKFRDTQGQFILEGDKIVRDTLQSGKISIAELIATNTWLLENNLLLSQAGYAVSEASTADLIKISSLETPPPVMAVLNIPHKTLEIADLRSSLSIGFDHVQDPGNLGTMIRTADWFGIRHICCGEGCADLYNPKVLQASMGAMLNLNIYYTNLPELVIQLAGDVNFPIYGTFLDGIPVTSLAPVKRGMIIFGNESRGISENLMPWIKNRITIPPAGNTQWHVESLNVASAMAIICAMLAHK